PFDRFRRSALGSWRREIPYFLSKRKSRGLKTAVTSFFHCRMQTLFVFPDRFALFEEGGDAFFEVGGATDAGVLQDRAFEVGIHAGLFGGDQQSLSAAKAARANLDEVIGQFAGARH